MVKFGKNGDGKGQRGKFIAGAALGALIAVSLVSVTAAVAKDHHPECNNPSQCEIPCCDDCPDHGKGKAEAR